MNLIAHYADTPTRGEEVANRMRKYKDFISSQYIGKRLRSIRTRNGAHYFFYRDSEVPSFQGMLFSGLIYHDEPPEKIRMELMARTVPAGTSNAHDAP